MATDLSLMEALSFLGSRCARWSFSLVIRTASARAYYYKGSGEFAMVEYPDGSKRRRELDQRIIRVRVRRKKGESIADMIVRLAHAAIHEEARPERQTFDQRMASRFGIKL